MRFFCASAVAFTILAMICLQMSRVLAIFGLPFCGLPAERRMAQNPPTQRLYF